MTLNFESVFSSFPMGRDRTVQLFRPMRQKFLNCPWIKEQPDKLKILPQAGMGRDSLSKSGTGRRMGQSLFFCQSPRRDKERDRTITIFPMISCFRRYFPVLERLFLFQNVLFCFRMSFSVLECPSLLLEHRLPFFGFFLESDFVPGRTRTKKVCPRNFAPVLVSAFLFTDN